MMWIKITAIADENDWFFISDQIILSSRCVKTSAARILTQVILSTVSAVQIACNPAIEWTR